MLFLHKQGLLLRRHLLV